MSDQLSNIHSSKKVHNGVVAVLILLAVFLAVKVISEFKGLSSVGVEPGQNIISVSGKGEVFAAADLATFSFSVETEGVTVAEAQKKSGDIETKAMRVLKDAGVEDKDIKTTSYSVGPKYEYNVKPCTAYSCPPGNPTIVGYQVNHTITVKVRDIDKAGALVSNLGETGVSNISNVDFTIDDEDALKAEARSKAIIDAREKAQRLAKDLGVSLGKVVSFSEDYGGPIYYGKAMEMGVGGANPQSAPNTSFATGENKVSVGVNVTYRIR